jgi:hypothetical protein
MLRDVLKLFTRFVTTACIFWNAEQKKEASDGEVCEELSWFGEVMRCWHCPRFSLKLAAVSSVWCKVNASDDNVW